jgi:hypothetical protein
MSIFNNPIRFNHNVQVSSLWKIAENLVDFGGKGYNVVALNPKTGRSLIAREKGNGQELSFSLKALKVITLAALYFSIIGGIAHIGVLVHNRNFIQVSKELRDHSFFPTSIEVLQQIVNERPENYGDTLTECKKITRNDINFMKSLKLKDMKFEDISNKTEFLLKNKKSKEFMKFSNRDPSRNELRGRVLRDLLEKNKEQNPNLTLYDAISKVITTIDSDVYKGMLHTFAYKNDGNNELLKKYAEPFLSP